MWALGHYLTDDAEGAQVLSIDVGAQPGSAGHMHGRPSHGVPTPAAKGPGDSPEPGCCAGQ